MDATLKRVITIVVSLFIIVYVVYQGIQMFYNPIKTETVYEYSGYDTVKTKGFTIRNETLIANKAAGYIYYTAENGSRVSKGGTIAEAFPAEEDCRTQQKLDRLNEDIALLEEIEPQGSSDSVNLDIIDKQLEQAVSELSVAVSTPSVSGMDEWQSKLLKLMNERQVTIGKVKNFSSRIAALNKLKQELTASYSKAISTISSPVAGYFVNKADGYENSVAYADATTLTADQLNKIMSSKPQSVPESTIGKVVSDYKWYLACAVSSADAGSLREGSTFTVVMPFVTDAVIPATVVAVNRDGSGNVAVIFECSYMSSALSSCRCETVQIRLEAYTGLRVPSDCIVTNAQGKQGVYTVVNDEVTFKKVEIIHSEPDYVICKETDDKSYLALYDDLIVEGKGLYNGKIIG